MRSSCEPCGQFQLTRQPGSTDASDCLCADNLFPDGNFVCRCQDDFFLTNEGRCLQCPALTSTEPGAVARGLTSCKALHTPGILALQLAIILLAAASLALLPIVFGLPPAAVSDVSLIDHKLIITTNLPHSLVVWARTPVPVQLMATGNPGLDSATGLRARRVSSWQLCLCHTDGQAIVEAMESSQGIVRVRFPHSILLCGFSFMPAAALVSSFGLLASYLLQLSHARVLAQQLKNREMTYPRSVEADRVALQYDLFLL